MKKILKILLYYPFIDPELSNRLEFDEELGAYVKSVVKAYDQQEALYKIEEEKLNTVFLNPIEDDGSINSTTIELIETIRNRFPRKVAIVLYTEIDSKQKLQTSYPEISFNRFIFVDVNKTTDEYYKDLRFALRDCYNYVASEVQQEETQEQKINTQPQSNSNSSVEIGVALLFAGVVLATLIFLVLNPRAMDEGTLAIVRFLAACFAGLAGYLFSGNLGLEGKILSLTKAEIKASGGFAAFIIVFILFFLPVSVSESQNSNSTDNSQSNQNPTLPTENININSELPTKTTDSNQALIETISEQIRAAEISAGRVDAKVTSVRINLTRSNDKDILEIYISIKGEELDQPSKPFFGRSIITAEASDTGLKVIDRKTSIMPEGLIRPSSSVESLVGRELSDVIASLRTNS